MARIAAITVEVIEHYTSLGTFKPNRLPLVVPYAERVRYAGNGRHHASRTRRPGAWLRSRLRDLGDALFGAFRMAD